MPSTFPNQTDGCFVMPGFRFRSGEVLPELRLQYLTLGAPERNSSGRIANAVLMLHGTTSTSRHFLRPSRKPLMRQTRSFWAATSNLFARFPTPIRPSMGSPWTR